MKNSILILLLGLLPAFMYSQSYIEKYNSLYERYELYDSNNNLVSYKKYNSFYNRWEYYEVKQSPNTYQGIKPADPTNWDAAYKALEYKQRKFDNGKLHIDNQIAKLRNDVNNNTNLSENERVILHNSIIDAINEINSKGKYDFSEDGIVNDIVNFIYSRYNTAIIRINNERQQKQTSEKKPNKYYPESIYKKFSEKMIKNFGEKLMVKSIDLYDKNGKFLKSESVDDDTYLYLSEGQIQFKKPNEPKAGIFLNFVTKENSIYKYSSVYSKPANIYIDEEFSYIKFIEPDQSYYIYTIK